MSGTQFSNTQLREFRKNGFAIERNLFESDVALQVRQYARQDQSLRESSYDRLDAEGRVTQLSLWNDPPPAPYGLIARSGKIVRRMEQVLDGEVYHWHSKMTLKEPHVGGAWEWHQDYGYWYHNGCLFPRLASCMVAFDRADRTNGALQVISGSHQLGRIDHGPIGDQTGADVRRVDVALERLERVDVELDPGDAVFFDCNLLHRSDANRSDSPRWAMICCYNAASNDPFEASRHPGYKRLNVADAGALAGWAAQQTSVTEGL